MALEFVEDYLEFLFGTLDKDGQPLRSPMHNPTIKLATYDKSPVASMGGYCVRARANNLEECLTDKQVGLARKIVGKYRRQLAEKGVILPEDIDSLPTRYNVRFIDRSRSLTADLDNKQFHLKFPYDPAIISALHSYSQESAGECVWDQTHKKWIFDLTEPNIQIVVDLFKDNNLKIDDCLAPFVEDVMKANPSQLPTVVFDNGEIVLRNCHPSIGEYLASKDCTSIEYAMSILSNLAVEYDASAKLELMERHGQIVAELICNEQYVMKSNNQPFGEWHDNLLRANHVLSELPWVFYLSWWTDKTDWSQFKNATMLKTSKQRGYNYIDPAIQDLEKDSIVVLDSVVGNDAMRRFVEQRAHKVIYISDIGPGL